MSLLGTVVSTVTGTVTSAANALTGTSTSSTDSGTDTDSDSSTSTSTSTSTTTSTPSTTTATPSTDTDTTSDSSDTSDTSTSTTTSTPSTTTATPSSTTTTPSATSSTSSSATATTSSDDTDEASTTSTTAPATSGSSAATTTTPSASTSTNTASSSIADTFSQSSSGSTQLAHSSSSSGSSTSLRSESNYGYGSTVAGGEGTATSDGLDTGSIIGISVGAVAAVLLVAALVFWFYQRKKRPRPSPRTCAIYELPLESHDTYNRNHSERFDTSSTSAGFSTFRTETKFSTGSTGSPGSASGSSMSRSGLWEDQAIKAMRIPLEKLTQTSLLSSGGYGEVYRGLYRGEVVAIKVLLPETRKDLHQINSFLAEIKLIATIEHPCIVRFIGVGWDSLSDLSAVLEFMEGGDLRTVLDHFETIEHRPHGFDLEKTKIAMQAAQALTYLHSLDPQVLHRDLKSRNILLTADLQAKLTDFGVSRKYTFSSMTACVGTQLWMAPEVMMGDRYDASADIFSFGIVLSELDSHLLPYAAAKETASGRKVPDTALLQLVAMGRLRVEFSPNAPPALVELGHACVALDPADRPTASEVHYQLQLIQKYEMYTL